jgi:large subunit ribosomal protein L9
MRVTLLEDIKALGTEGQIVEVPEGYAMHFLFPQHMAVREEGHGDAVPERRPPSKAELAEEKLAAEIDGLEVVVPVKSLKGRLKTPVTNTEIRAVMKELGYSVEKKAIKTKAIESFGTVEVPVEFPSGFDALIRVTVEPA